MPVRLTPTGPIIICWDDESDEWVSIRQTRIFPLLSQYTEIQPGVTVADVFSFVEKDDLLKQFLSDYCSCDIEKLHADSSGAPANLTIPNLEKNALGKMVFGREMPADFVTISADGALLDHESTDDTLFDIMRQVIIRSSENEEVGSSVSFPNDAKERKAFIAALAKMPIRIESEITVFNWREPVEPDETESEESSESPAPVEGDDDGLPVIFSSPMRWTLLEILATIYDTFSQPMFDNRYQAEIEAEQEVFRRFRATKEGLVENEMDDEEDDDDPDQPTEE